jgi:hypothetical protein
MALLLLCAVLAWPFTWQVAAMGRTRFWTSRSWQPCRAPSTFLPLLPSMIGVQQCSSKPTAPHRASGGLRGQWHRCNTCKPLLHRSLFSFIYRETTPTIQPAVQAPRARYRTYSPLPICWTLHEARRSTPAGSHASDAFGKGPLRALALPPARQASTPVIRCPRHFSGGPRLSQQTINLHALPAAFQS